MTTKQKECQVVLVPTDKLDNHQLIVFNTVSKMFFTGQNIKNIVGKKNEHLIPQHLYILSDDEIKEGDWYISQGNIYQCTALPLSDKNAKKIIATTNPELKLAKKKWYNVLFPTVSNEFLQEYISRVNRNILVDKVLVDYLEWEHFPKDRSEDMMYGNIVYLPKLLSDNTISISFIEEETLTKAIELAFDKLSGLNPRGGYVETKIIKELVKVSVELGFKFGQRSTKV